MAATWVSTADVLVGYYSDETPATEDVENLLAGAVRKIEARLGDLDTWAGTDERRLAAVTEVVSSMVQRVLRSGGSAYDRESDGDYSYSRSAVAASANLWVTEEEWALLLGAATTLNLGVGTMRLGIPEWSGKARW